MFANTGDELIDKCKKRNLSIWEYTLEEEIKSEKLII